MVWPRWLLFSFAVHTALNSSKVVSRGERGNHLNHRTLLLDLSRFCSTKMTRRVWKSIVNNDYIETRHEFRSAHPSGITFLCSLSPSVSLSVTAPFSQHSSFLHCVCIPSHTDEADTRPTIDRTKHHIILNGKEQVGMESVLCLSHSKSHVLIFRYYLTTMCQCTFYNLISCFLLCLL